MDGGGRGMDGGSGVGISRKSINFFPGKKVRLLLHFKKVAFLLDEMTFDEHIVPTHNKHPLPSSAKGRRWSLRDIHTLFSVSDILDRIELNGNGAIFFFFFFPRQMDNFYSPMCIISIIFLTFFFRFFIQTCA
jgi:hypothetical protein